MRLTWYKQYKKDKRSGIYSKRKCTIYTCLVPDVSLKPLLICFNKNMAKLHPFMCSGEFKLNRDKVVCFKSKNINRMLVKTIVEKLRSSNCIPGDVNFSSFNILRRTRNMLDMSAKNAGYLVHPWIRSKLFRPLGKEPIKEKCTGWFLSANLKPGGARVVRRFISEKDAYEYMLNALDDSLVGDEHRPKRTIVKIYSDDGIVAPTIETFERYSDLFYYLKPELASRLREQRESPPHVSVDDSKISNSRMIRARSKYLHNKEMLRRFGPWGK